MKKNRNELTVFITDQGVGLVQQPTSIHEKIQETLPLEAGIVDYGLLVDAPTLYKKLLSFYKEKKINPLSVKFVIQEQNILIREMMILKTELGKSSILDYIKKRQGEKGFQFPFAASAISYHIRKETDYEYYLSVFVTDENLITDYYDVFERLGAKSVRFTMPSLSLFHYYQRMTEYDLSNTLLVTLYDRMISIDVIENNAPVFSMIEDLEVSGDEFYETVENYIERIANYYRYNLRKDSMTIYNALVFNVANRIEQDRFFEKMGLKLKSFITTIVDFSTLDDSLSDIDKTTYVAYAANAEQNNDCICVNFKIDRIIKSKLYANYVLVFALFLFSAVSLLYIPYQLQRNRLNEAESQVASLELYLSQLKADLLEEMPSNAIIHYNEAYEFLQAKEHSSADYLSDLTVYVTGTLEIDDYQIDQIEKKIVLTIGADNETELSEFLILVYEAYGIVEGIDDDNRWMVSMPLRVDQSGWKMEVTIYYA